MDVSAGYVGLDDYQPVVIATLMALSTYAGPLFWIISLLRVVVQPPCGSSPADSETETETAAVGDGTSHAPEVKRSREVSDASSATRVVSDGSIATEEQWRDFRRAQRRALLDACAVVLLTRALPLAVYTTLVTAQRYHLFVWTVFSPKLLYEAMHAVVLSVVVLLVLGARCVL